MDTRVLWQSEISMKQIIQTHVIVALDSIDESLISHNLGFSIEECLETLFDCLQLLLTDLRAALTDRRQTGYYSL